MEIEKNNCLYRFLFIAGLLWGLMACEDRRMEETPAPSEYHPDGSRKGMLYVKFAASPELNMALATRSGSARIGVKSVDDITASLGDVKMERVFPDAGKFEKRHRKYGLDRWYRLIFDKDTDLTKVTGNYAASPAIECVEPEYETEICSLPVAPFNDPGLCFQWHYDVGGNLQTASNANIGLFKAWQVTAGSPEVIVAIVDLGIDCTHPDLAADMWVNKTEQNGKPGIDDDGNGYVDDVYGYDFKNNTGNITGCKHGTHVAGTVAAVNNNGVGVCGIAGGTGKGDGVRLISCQIGVERSPMGGHAEAIAYAADNGAVICQCSWGAKNLFNTILKDAIDMFVNEAGCDENGVQTGPMKGGVLFFAAGNDWEKNPPYYPAAYEAVVAVAATTTQNTRAVYSNYADWVDLSAPGGDFNEDDKRCDIYSTYANGQYGYDKGTSMACPHVSGIAALVVAAKGAPGYTNEMLKERLFKSTIELSPAEPDRDLMGRGLLRADLALWDDDHVPPETVENLEIKKTDDNVVLNWTVTADPNDRMARTYRVYGTTTPLLAGGGVPGENVPYVTLETDGKKTGDLMSYTIPPVTDGKIIYYAVVGSDLWGNFSAVSNVVRYEWKNNSITSDAFKVYPNPVVKTVKVQWGEGFSGEKTVSLYDMSGRRVYTQPVNRMPGSGTMEFDLSSVASGKYILELKSAGVTRTCNILKR